MDSEARVASKVRYPGAGAQLLPDLSKRDRGYLKRAVELARKRDVAHQSHAAIVVRGSKVLASGFNSYKNDPRSLSDEHIRMVPGRNQVMGVGVHSEVAALQQISSTAGVTVYVARALKNGEVGNSAPCEGCWQAMREAGVRRVFWTEEDFDLDR